MTEEKKVEIKIEDIKTEAEIKGCPVKKALYYIAEFLAGPMCGKCFPCALGSYEARIILNNITEGRGSEEDLFNLKRIAKEMLISSRCKKGKDTAKFILEWMGTGLPAGQAGVFKDHVDGRCPDMTCAALIEYRIIPEKCTMCGICLDVCKDNAIIGEKKKSYLSGYLPFEVVQKRCTKCDECIKVCPIGAIIVIDAKDREAVGA